MYKYLIVSCFLLLSISCKEKKDDTPSTQTVLRNVLFEIETEENKKYTINKSLKGNISVIKHNGEAIDFMKSGNDSISIKLTKREVPVRNTLDLSFDDGASSQSITFIGRAPSLAYDIVETRPHDPSNFTQGLLFDDGVLYESTGIEGRSKIIKYKESNGNFVVDKTLVNRKNEFGEGLAVKDDKLIQLLWKNGYLRIYDKLKFTHVEDIPYANEGWGAAFYNGQLYVSDGTGAISVINLDEKIVRKVFELPVQDFSGTIANINELEIIKGKIFANVWQTSNIIIIDPNDGIVEGIINLNAITKKEKSYDRRAEVLNGIAYNEKKDEIWITGKLWKNFYKIELN